MRRCGHKFQNGRWTSTNPTSMKTIDDSLNVSDNRIITAHLEGHDRMANIWRLYISETFPLNK